MIALFRFANRYHLQPSEQQEDAQRAERSVLPLSLSLCGCAAFSATRAIT
jgi:hypothetical protein